MKYDMFCYQCEQTVGGKGCTKVGVCGKTPEIAALQDLLIYQLKGLSFYAAWLLEKGKKIDKTVVCFVEYSLFTTLTNVNFDADIHVELLKKSQKIKEDLRSQASECSESPSQATYNLSIDRADMLKDAKRAGIMYDRDLDEDIRSLQQTILYGLKGISAYGHQARELGFHDAQVDEFYYRCLAAITDDKLTVEDLIAMTMRVGDMSVAILKKLDEANVAIYRNPIPRKVNVKIKKGPFIIVSGHDLKDLQMILEQTKGKGIHIYTHGEMLPCHGYPELSRHEHLVGNFGGAWQEQQKEFDGIPGCIVMTTNCLMRPRESYKDRIFSTNVVGWDGVKYIGKDQSGNKDFSEVIQKALILGGFKEEEEPKEIMVGFGHHAVLEHAEKIIKGVKDGDIRHFFLIGGCDGAREGRNYYTRFAEIVPKNCIILTLACGKYRFNKFDFGTVAGLPRLLDIGQCNDAYSAVKIALALADAFDTDINSLPLSIILSWYEQKAVADLLALLALNVKGIYLGPSLPAFISPNVLQYLIDTFTLKPISTAEKDLTSCLLQK